MCQAVIDRRISVVNAWYVDGDEPRARFDDILTTLVRQDLDPLSVGELEARILQLQGEIDRVRAKIQFAVNHKASAETLFKS